jgi:hypothetical protein
VLGQVNLDLRAGIDGTNGLGDGASAMAAGHVVNAEGKHCSFPWVVDTPTFDIPIVGGSSQSAENLSQVKLCACRSLDAAFANTSLIVDGGRGGQSAP